MSVPAAPSDAPEMSADGRLARRDRNRLAVLDAVIELFSEGVLDPTPDDVATRVGLSARSVYRYFDDRDALVRAAINRHLERMIPLFLIHAIGEGHLDERIDRFVTSRLRLYEAVAAAFRASRARGPEDELIREQVEATRRALREQTEKHFAPELDALDASRRRARSAAADALTQFDTLDLYRVHRGFSSSEARMLLADALHALLDPCRPERTTHG
jgi:AcrR family transcriptional regulator